MVERLLLRFKADAALASEVQAIVKYVSYMKEVKDPAKVQAIGGWQSSKMRIG